MLLDTDNKYRDGRKARKRMREGARFIHALQLGLLQKALAPWPRRSANLLEINCGDGSYFPFLWRSGFDVTATEADPVLRERARARRLEIEVAAAGDGDLPFDNDYFDWVIHHVQPGPDSRLEASFREGLRVARKGLLFSFWNSASIPCLCWRLSHRQGWPPRAMALPKVWRMIRSLRTGSMSVMTTLCAPYCSWRNGAFFTALNSSLAFLPVGGWAVIRLDLGKPRLVTPLRLRLENAFAQASPAMEFAEKNLAQKQD